MADQVHVVKKGDTLYSLSKRYGVTVEQIKNWNKLSGSGLKTGQKIVIRQATKNNNQQVQSGKGFKLYVVKPKETLWRIAYQHGVPVKTLIELNNINDVSGIKVGQKLRIPANAVQGTATGAGQVLQGNIRLARPAPGNIVPSSTKNGINILCSDRENVKAVNDGTVEYTGNLVGYRNVVIVNHGKDLYSIYAALGPVHVEKGDKVRKGQIIGNVEKLPHYERPFLYLELVSGGTYLNPAKYIY